MAKLGHRPLFVCSKALKESNALPSVVNVDESLRKSMGFDNGGGGDCRPPTASGNFSTSILKRIDMYYCDDLTELRMLLASVHLHPHAPTALIIDNLTEMVFGASTNASREKPESKEGMWRLVQAVGFLRDALCTVRELLSIESADAPKPAPASVPSHSMSLAKLLDQWRVPLMITANSADASTHIVEILRRHLLLTHEVSLSSTTPVAQPQAPYHLQHQQQQQQKQQHQQQQQQQQYDQESGDKQLPLPLRQQAAQIQQLFPPKMTATLVIKELKVPGGDHPPSSMLAARRLKLTASKPEDLVESESVLLLSLATDTS
jgi:hypothetical protein